MPGRPSCRTAPVPSRAPLAVLVALALLAPACAFGPEAERRIPGGYTLVQKADFQALYDKDGRLVRLLQDRNHDGRAEVIIHYYPNGKPRLGEIDTDEDGVIDRWEYFRTDGTLEKVGRGRSGHPDTWE